jgi:hypothetical protein
MAYVPPTGNAVVLDFLGAYSVPSGSGLTLEFNPILSAVGASRSRLQVAASAARSFRGRLSFGYSRQRQWRHDRLIPSLVLEARHSRRQPQPSARHEGQVSAARPVTITALAVGAAAGEAAGSSSIICREPRLLGTVSHQQMASHRLCDWAPSVGVESVGAGVGLASVTGVAAVGETLIIHFGDGAAVHLGVRGRGRRSNFLRSRRGIDRRRGKRHWCSDRGWRGIFANLADSSRLSALQSAPRGAASILVSGSAVGNYIAAAKGKSKKRRIEHGRRHRHPRQALGVGAVASAQGAGSASIASRLTRSPMGR